MSSRVGAPFPSAALFRVTLCDGRAARPGKDGERGAGSFYPLQVPLWTGQWAPKPGTGVGGAPLVPKLWDGSGSPPSLILGLSAVTVQCSVNWEIQTARRGKIR